MRYKNYKFWLIAFLPFFLLAFSPTSRMLCAEKMENCSSCCHEVNVKSSHCVSQLNSFDACCVTHSNGEITALVSLQKVEDVSKKKFHPIASLLPELDSFALQHLKHPELSFSHSFAFLPHPPLILIKSSLLI